MTASPAGYSFMLDFARGSKCIVNNSQETDPTDTLGCPNKVKDDIILHFALRPRRAASVSAGKIIVAPATTCRFSTLQQLFRRPKCGVALSVAS